MPRICQFNGHFNGIKRGENNEIAHILDQFPQHLNNTFTFYRNRDLPERSEFLWTPLIVTSDLYQIKLIISYILFPFCFPTPLTKNVCAINLMRIGGEALSFFYTPTKSPLPNVRTIQQFVKLDIRSLLYIK